MSRCTEEQLEEVMRYKAEKTSTMAEDEDRNMISIMSMSDDLLKTIKNTQRYLWTDTKRKMIKNNKNYAIEKYDRNCYTERGNSPEQNLDRDGLSQFDESQISINQNDNLMKKIEKFKFLQLNDVEKSEYVPMKKKLNPEQGNIPKKLYENKNDLKISKVQKGTTKKNNLQVDIQTPSTINHKKSKILTQTRSSLTLTNPIKHVKKHILQAVQIKKQAEQKRYCQTPKHTSIKQFYTQNTDHIPLYEKSKILTAKKLINLQQSRMMKQSAEIQEVTFWPMINNKSEELIQGTTFYSRLQDTMNRKQTNQVRIIYETMKPCTFVPKLNDNKLIESKVRKIWIENDTDSFQPQNVITQEEEDENFDNHEIDKKNWLAIRLQKDYAEKLFID